MLTFFFFCSCPERVHLGQIAVFGALAARREQGFDAAKAALELSIGCAEGSLWFNAKVPTQVGHDKHKVTVFL